MKIFPTKLIFNTLIKCGCRIFKIVCFCVYIPNFFRKTWFFTKSREIFL